MYAFSPEVEDVLLQAGWFPARSVATSQWVGPLEQVGYKPFPAAIRILENLGGLVITPPTNESNLFYPGQIVFDPVFAASSEFKRVEKWQDEYGLRLFPLGEYDPLFILMCSDNGRIFGAREQLFHFLGATIEVALELQIFARRRPIVYPKWKKAAEKEDTAN
jgi:hypothetical protein